MIKKHTLEAKKNLLIEQIKRRLTDYIQFQMPATEGLPTDLTPDAKQPGNAAHDAVLLNGLTYFKEPQGLYETLAQTQQALRDQLQPELNLSIQQYCAHVQQHLAENAGKLYLPFPNMFSVTLESIESMQLSDSLREQLNATWRVIFQEHLRAPGMTLAHIATFTEHVINRLNQHNLNPLMVFNPQVLVQHETHCGLIVFTSRHKEFLAKHPAYSVELMDQLCKLPAFNSGNARALLDLQCDALQNFEALQCENKPRDALNTAWRKLISLGLTKEWLTPEQALEFIINNSLDPCVVLALEDLVLKQMGQVVLQLYRNKPLAAQLVPFAPQVLVALKKIVQEKNIERQDAQILIQCLDTISPALQEKDKASADILEATLLKSITQPHFSHFTDEIAEILDAYQIDTENRPDRLKSLTMYNKTVINPYTVSTWNNLGTQLCNLLAHYERPEGHWYESLQYWVKATTLPLTRLRALHRELQAELRDEDEKAYSQHDQQQVAGGSIITPLASPSPDSPYIRRASQRNLSMMTKQERVGPGSNAQHALSQQHGTLWSPTNIKTSAQDTPAALPAASGGGSAKKT